MKPLSQTAAFTLALSCLARLTMPLLADDVFQGVDLAAERAAYLATPEAMNEPLRPQFHFTPPLNWMNDPNGLVFHDGEYHLFYQHNPLGNEWGHMSWGHAVSSDLVHWQQLPLAIPEADGEMAFSGCCVVDHPNTAGFGTADTPAMVAIYTGHAPGRQVQNLAFSLDNGRSWEAYEGNPVLDEGLADFRDPKVFWHDETGRWVMVVSRAIEKVLVLYGSENLKDWKELSRFGPAGAITKPNWSARISSSCRFRLPTARGMAKPPAGCWRPTWAVEPSLGAVAANTSWASLTASVSRPARPPAGSTTAATSMPPSASTTFPVPTADGSGSAG